MYSVVLMLAMTGGADTPAAGNGCYGCYGGGCYGGGGYGGGYGCRGGHGCRGGYGCRGGCNGCNGCYGGRAYYGCCGGGYGCGGGGAPAAPPPPPVEGVKKMPAEDQVRGAAPATLIVNLPADAQLTIDDAPTTSTSERRTLVSPPLAQGKDYYYTLKAEAMRDGQKVTASKQVIVRPGQRTVVQLELLSVPVALR